MARPGALDASTVLDLGAVLKGGRPEQRGYLGLHGGGKISRIPIAVITGSSAGPTAWVTSGGQGDPLGAATLARILPALQPAMVSGRLIVTPLLDVGGPAEGDRDGLSHRAPWGPAMAGLGRANPSAGDLAPELMDSCDVVVELGSGGEGFLRAPLVTYPAEGGKVEETSAVLARAAGFPLIRAAKREGPEGSLMEGAAGRGRAAVLIEVGGGGRTEEAWVANMALALQGVLARAGILRGSPRELPSYRVFGGASRATTKEGGLWRRALEPEVSVGRGGVVGRVLDPFGREAEVVESPTEATVLGVRVRGGVAARTTVAELGHG